LLEETGSGESLKLFFPHTRSGVARPCPWGEEKGRPAPSGDSGSRRGTPDNTSTATLMARTTG